MNARSHEKALRLINEHLGEEVYVAVELDIGFGYSGVLGASGTLMEWRHPEGRTHGMLASPGGEPRACTVSATPSFTFLSRATRGSLTRWPVQGFRSGCPTTSV
jgi:hypothetical protein